MRESNSCSFAAESPLTAFFKTASSLALIAVRTGPTLANGFCRKLIWPSVRTAILLLRPQQFTSRCRNLSFSTCHFTGMQGFPGCLTADREPIFGIPAPVLFTDCESRASAYNAGLLLRGGQSARPETGRTAIAPHRVCVSFHWFSAAVPGLHQFGTTLC